MSDWRPMKDAPRDGTWIQAEIPGHGSENVIAFVFDGLVDEDEQECGAWSVVTEQEPPDCWTDGYCWEVNEDGVPSAYPTRWKPLPGELTSPFKSEGN